MPRVSPATIEQIRDAVDLPELIASYGIGVKRTGGRFKALCPFHQEKTPSFTINPDSKTYHCFGCHAGGDPFRFVMEYERVDFMGAIERLAARTGVALQYEAGGSTPGQRDERERLRQVQARLADFFRECLGHDRVGAGARAYLEERRIASATWDAFQFGYAPAEAEAVPRWARAQAIPTPDLIEAGVLARGDGDRVYCRFRERLMIPIRDEMGRVIAFTGRVLRADQPGGKYVNSPETALFHKSRVLFAYDLARKPMLDARTAVVCEGQLDAIRCHQAGFTHTVATQGTALTPEHARLLKRAADTVILVLDADTAGREAALRATQLLLAAELEVRIAALPEGEDPDSLIVRQGPEAFGQILAGAGHALDYQHETLSRRPEFAGAAGRIRLARELLQTIHNIPNALRQDDYLARAARLLEAREDALRRELGRTQRPPQAPQADRPPRPEPGPPPAEFGLAECLLAAPEVAPLVTHYLRLARDLTHAPTRALCALLIAQAPEPTWRLAAQLNELDEPVGRLAAALLASERLAASQEQNPREIAQDFIRTLRRQSLEREWRALSPAARTAATGVQSAQLKHDLAILRDRKRGWLEVEPVLDLLAD